MSDEAIILCEWRDGAPEEWIPIPSLPLYSVSSYGRVRRDIAVKHSPRTGNILSQRPLPRGHMQVTVSIGGRPTTRLVHRLVAEAFLPPPPAGKDCVLHRDDNPANNAPSNLWWGTKPENSADMVRKGRQCRGDRIKSAKLKPRDVAEIRRCAASGERQRDIANRFNVSQSNISMLVNGVTWGHVK